MAISPACLVNNGSVPAVVAATTSFEIELQFPAGVNFWSIDCKSTDETSNSSNVNATKSVNMTTKKATFTSTAVGSAMIFTSTIGIMGPGLDADGVPQASYTTTFKVNVLTGGGLTVMAASETIEQDPAFGWIVTPNQTARSGGGGGSGIGNQGQFNITLANGLNSNISTTGLSLLRIGGPTAAFSIDGIATSASSKAGLPIVLVNTTAFPCTLVEEGSGSTAANRLNLNRPSGGSSQTLTLAPLGGSAVLYYDTTGNRWSVQSSGWQYRRVVDPRDFGADVTGGTHSTAAFKAAMAFACANQLPFLIPQPGIFYLNEPIIPSAKVRVFGDQISNASGFNQPVVRPNYFGSFWGGGYVGPAFLLLPTTLAHPVTYVSSGGFNWAEIGNLDGHTSPLLYLSELVPSSLNGLTAFSLEYNVNATTVPTATVFPWVGGGKTTNSPLTTAFNIAWNNTGPFGMTATLTTTNGVFTVATSGTAFSLTTDYAIAATYDGANLKLFAGTPGSSPSITATVAATGTVVQNWWEEFILGASQTPGQWPFGTTDGTGQMKWSNFRKSKVARTITTLRGTEFDPTNGSDCDSNTDLMVVFSNVHNNRFTPSVIVAACGHPLDYGFIVGAPASMPLQWRRAINVITENGPPGITFESFAIESNTDCINIEGTQQFRTNQMTLSGRRAITHNGDSYYGGHRNMTLTALGTRLTALAGTVTVTNGSPNLTFDTAQSLAAGGVIEFSDQPGVEYFISASTTSSTSAVMRTNYTGTGGAGKTAIYAATLPVSQTWGIGLLQTSGAGAVLENVQLGSTCAGTAGFVLAGTGDVHMRDCSINTISGQCGLIANQNAGDLVLIGCGFGDEGGGVGDSAVLFDGMQSVSWIGGGLFVAGGFSTTACVRIDGGTSYRFAFDPAVAGGSATAVFKGISNPSDSVCVEHTYQGQGLETPVAWTDGTLPLIVTTREISGRGSVVFPGDADYTPPANSSFWGYIRVTSSGSLTAKHKVTTVRNVGKTSAVRNDTTGSQTITWIGSTGTGVDILPGQTLAVYDDGTNIVAA